MYNSKLISWLLANALFVAFSSNTVLASNISNGSNVKLVFSDCSEFPPAD